MKYMKWLTPSILEIRFEKSYDLCDATYRFSHYYEDPDVAGKLLTRDELDAHRIKKDGYVDMWKNKWAGSNMPDTTFAPFIDGRLTGLNAFETKLVNEVKDKTAPYYVVMTSDEGISARPHELAHAMYYTNDAYKSKAIMLINKWLPYLGEARVALTALGYANGVLVDELHVYCGIYFMEYFNVKGIPVPLDMRQDLVKLFKEYGGDTL